MVWAILRALGKRIEQLGRTKVKVWWMDAQRWLAAHRIVEVVVLCAQHLRGATAEELERHLVAKQRGIALTFVYSGRLRTPAATTTLCAFLDRPRERPSAHRLARGSPRLLRSHPLRLRYDCAQQLSPDEFEQVDRLLLGSLRTLGGWWWSMGYPSRGQLTRTLRVICVADDPDQAYIRRCAAELALIAQGIATPRTPTLRPGARWVTAAQIDALLAYTDSAVAGYLLAGLVTGLTDEMLELIAGDQITEDAILGCPVPKRARPILRALDDHHEPVLRRPGGPVVLPVADATAARSAPADAAVATALGWLLRHRDARIPLGDTPTAVRTAREAPRWGHPRARARRVPGERDRAVQQLPAPPPRRPSRQHPGRFIAIDPDCH